MVMMAALNESFAEVEDDYYVAEFVYSYYINLMFDSCVIFLSSTTFIDIQYTIYTSPRG